MSVMVRSKEMKRNTDVIQFICACCHGYYPMTSSITASRGTDQSKIADHRETAQYTEKVSRRHEKTTGSLKQLK